jgi:hypothetical protein
VVHDSCTKDARLLAGPPLPMGKVTQAICLQAGEPELMDCLLSSWPVASGWPGAELCTCSHPARYPLEGIPDSGARVRGMGTQLLEQAWGMWAQELSSVVLNCQLEVCFLATSQLLR